MQTIYINTDRPVDRAIVASPNQPQREAPIGAFVAGSVYDANLFFVLNDGKYDPNAAGKTVEVAISTIGSTQSGTFTITDGSDTTDAIEYGASAQVVEDAINALNAGAGADLGTPSLVDVEKVSNDHYSVVFRELGAMTALSGASVSLYPESSATSSIAVPGSATQYAQQIIEITRQPAVYQSTWTAIANGYNGELALNTTRLLQSLLIDQGAPFYIEVKLDGQTVAREVVGMETSTMPASAFSEADLPTLLDLFAANPASNGDFSRATWEAALTGLMDKATYDPTSKNADAFARANHTGTQPASTISGFDTKVTNNATVAANTAKLTGIEDGATADQDLSALQAKPSEGAFIDGDKTKLDGIEDGATANDSDANLQARANHTGTQTAATISDFDTEVSNNSSVTANTAKATNVTTNLSTTQTTTTVDVASSDGTDATLPQAIASGNAGVMSGADKAKLDSCPSSDPTGITGADAITNVISLTQAEYDAITTPHSTTLYVVTD